MLDPLSLTGVYGPHTKLVEDVIAFARSGRLLRGGPAPSGVLTVDEFERARHCAWEATTDGEDSLNWIDIRAYKMRKVVAKGYSTGWYRKLDDDRVTLGELLSDHVDDTLPSPYVDAFNDVEADLINIADVRMLFAATDEFWEGLFAAYLAGGWPCGWTPDYPKGQLIVYVPR